MSTPRKILTLAALFLCLPSLVSEYPAATNTRELANNAERLTNTFRITSNTGDAASTEYVQAACTRLEQMFTTISPWRRQNKEWRIHVELDSPTSSPPKRTSPPNAPTPPPYSLSADAASPPVSLRIRWDNALSPEDFTRALVHALYARILLAYNAAKPAETVPVWLVEALTREFTLAEMPSVLDEWARQSIAMRPLPIETFTRANAQGAPASPAPADERFSLQAFWFLRFLNQELSAQKKLHGHLLAELARGKTLANFLAETFPEEWEDADRRALWWPMGYAQMTRNRMVGTHSMADSRILLEKASSFVFAIEGADAHLTPIQLVPLRDQNAVQAEISARLLSLKVSLQHINPVWHNAWLAYGIFLEKFGDTRMDNSALLRLWETTRTEIATARALEAEVFTALQQAAQKMPAETAPHTKPKE
ncbi:MAG: hypothetical protein LBD01_04640 [Puniceicoccales bacterium]|jgi:hypothetical protein|nr:hypothetical protein [Puniceicoccales bacterium]